MIPRMLHPMTPSNNPILSLTLKHELSTLQIRRSRRKHRISLHKSPNRQFNRPIRSISIRMRHIIIRRPILPRLDHSERTVYLLGRFCVDGILPACFLTVHFYLFYVTVADYDDCCVESLELFWCRMLGEPFGVMYA